MVEQVGAFVPDLFARGEYWRAVTTHFLHGLPAGPASMPYLPGLPIHLAVNVGGLIVLGPLVERPLGSARTAIVLGLSGVGTIVGILFAGHLEVIGASGLVSGLAGAILALEFHFPETLPAYWRLPRRLFVIAVILQFFVIDRLLSDYVAGGAHLGGFVGGYLAALWLGRPDLERAPASPRLRFATLSVVAIVVAGIVGAVPLARHDMGALERHAIRLLDSPESLHLFRHDNAAAWLIATEGGATPQDLTLAVALADRAVENTGRQLPGLLDTLAEALFQSGDRLGALVTIDEAIRLDPRERYFIEQRRRFTGERAENDRPPPPGSEPLTRRALRSGPDRSGGADPDDLKRAASGGANSATLHATIVRIAQAKRTEYDDDGTQHELDSPPGGGTGRRSQSATSDARARPRDRGRGTSRASTARASATRWASAHSLALT